MNNFYVGQKVVCIKLPDNLTAWVEDGAPICGLPQRGQVYTIEGIINDCEGCWLLLAEFNVLSEEDQDIFIASYFRPVLERKTDISVFQKMLTPSEIEKSRVLCGND